MEQEVVQNRSGTALITGASSGIGLELSKLFARGGYDVVLVARQEAALRGLAEHLTGRYGVAATVLPADLALTLAPALLQVEIERQGRQIDVLVNNAGFASYGPFATLDLAHELELIQVNAVALTHLTGLFLPGMLARHAGRLLNVASTAAFQPGPLMAVYYASKAYVLSFSEALANELQGSGVTVTALCPGPTRTGFQRRAQMEDSGLVQGEIMDARSVARSGYRGLMQGKSVVIPGLRNRLLVEAERLLPRGVVTNYVRRIQERVGGEL